MWQHNEGEDRHWHNWQQGIIGDSAGQQETLIASEIMQYIDQETKEPTEE